MREFVVSEGGNLLIDIPILSAVDKDKPEDLLTFMLIKSPKHGIIVRKRPSGKCTTLLDSIYIFINAWFRPFPMATRSKMSLFICLYDTSIPFLFSFPFVVSLVIRSVYPSVMKWWGHFKGHFVCINNCVFTVDFILCSRGTCHSFNHLYRYLPCKPVYIARPPFQLYLLRTRWLWNHPWPVSPQSHRW